MPNASYRPQTNATEGGRLKSTRAERKRRTVGLQISISSLANGREDYEARLVLVRPDQYVAWVGDAEPVDVDGIICKAAGLDVE